MSQESKPAVGGLMAGPVSTALRSMAVPMGIGMIFMILVNIIDTFWVAQLGTLELAAMTFTFPVVGLVINVSLGIMIGTSTAVARAIGQGRAAEAARLTMHALLLALVTVIVITVLGLYLQEPLFRLLGASEEMLGPLQAYMRIWFLGMIFLIIPVVINGSLRAVGDARTPMRVMIIAAVINAILDPLLIFGLGPIPRLGLEGAALATLVARFLGMIYTVWVLVTKTPLFVLEWPRPSAFLSSCRQILSVGLPAAVTNALTPLAVGVITTMIAQFGPDAVAAYGIGARLDALVLIAPNAVASALSPFIGQNWGAHLRLRVAEGIRTGLVFGLAWGVVGAVVLFASASWVAAGFTNSPEVSRNLVVYLQSVPIGYAFLAAAAVASSSFNAVDRAVRSTWLSLLRSLILAVPCAWVGAQLGDLRGLFIGLVVAAILASVTGVRWLQTLLDPNGHANPERPVSLDRTALDARLTGALSALRPFVSELLALEGVSFQETRGGLLGVYVGRRELGHFHRDGRLDLPLPVEIGENLIRFGRLSHHAGHEDSGWFSHPMNTADDGEQVFWLLRMSHLLLELSQRGIGDPVTQTEIRDFVFTEQCVAALTAAATRWDLEVEAPALA